MTEWKRQRERERATERERERERERKGRQREDIARERLPQRVCHAAHRALGFKSGFEFKVIGLKHQKQGNFTPPRVCESMNL